MQTTAPAVVSGDGAQLDHAAEASTPAAVDSQQGAHCAHTGSSAAANATGGGTPANAGAAVPTGGVYKKHDRITSKDGGREWRVASVDDEDKLVTLVAPRLNEDGTRTNKHDIVMVPVDDIHKVYDHEQVTAQADGQVRQAPAVLSTQPTDSAEVGSGAAAGIATQAFGVTQPHNATQATESVAARQFMLMPEFTAPEWSKRHGGAEYNWTCKQDTTLHPFWAVRRISGSVLTKEIDDAMRNDTDAPKFNCKLKPFVVDVTTGAVFDATAMMDIRRCTLAGITNYDHITKGSELLMRIPEPEIADGESEPARKHHKYNTTAQAALLT